MALKDKMELILERHYPRHRWPQKIHELALRMRRYDIDVARFMSGGRNTEKFYDMMKTLDPIAKEVDVDLLADDEHDVVKEALSSKTGQSAKTKTRGDKKKGSGHVPSGRAASA